MGTRIVFPEIPAGTVRSMDEMLGALRMPDSSAREPDGWRRSLLPGEAFRVDYDQNIASGGWEFHRLGHGLALSITDMVARQAIPRRHFLGDHLVLTTILEGTIPLNDGSGTDSASSGYCTVYGLPTGAALHTVYEPGRPLKWVTVYIERHSLFHITGLRTQDLPESINQFLLTGSSLPLHHVALSPAASLTAHQIMERPFSNGFLTSFLKAKALELASHILFRLTTTAKEQGIDDSHLSLSDQHKLQQAMAIIERDLAGTPDVNDLGAAVGLSRPKLQLGFRLLYGDTVARIRDKRRMERALKLVRSTTLSMIDIAAEVGYDHAASFTRVFKAAFGESPIKVRRMAQQSALLNKMKAERTR